MNTGWACTVVKIKVNQFRRKRDQNSVTMSRASLLSVQEKYIYLGHHEHGISDVDIANLIRGQCATVGRILKRPNPENFHKEIHKPKTFWEICLSHYPNCRAHKKNAPRTSKNAWIKCKHPASSADTIITSLSEMQKSYKSTLYDASSQKSEARIG